MTLLRLLLVGALFLVAGCPTEVDDDDSSVADDDDATGDDDDATGDDDDATGDDDDATGDDDDATGPAPEDVSIQFFVLIHAGEGGVPACIVEHGALDLCYDSQPSGSTDGQIAAACAAEEASVEACVLDTANAPGVDKSCKLENFDVTRDRTHPRYDHGQAARYAMCRDGLIDVLQGLADLGVPATVQLHGGFLENLAWEDSLTGGPFSFTDHLVGLGHEVSLHWHTECELGTAPPAVCQDVDAIQPVTTSWGTSWGKAAPGLDDDTFPSTQALQDTRLESAFGAVDTAATFGGWFASNPSPITSISGWGIPWRLAEDLRGGTTAQLDALAAAGIGVITSGNDFPVHLESACFDGLTPSNPADALAARTKAPPHPIELGPGLVFYDSPAPLWGQPGNDDPNEASSHHQENFLELLACVDARLSDADQPGGDVVRYDGQTFVWSGTTHLHNLIEGPDAAPSGGGPPVRAGVAEISHHLAVLESLAAAHTSAVVNSVTIERGTLSAVEAARNQSANYGFTLRLDEDPQPD